MPRILAFAGSSRAASFNKKLVALAAEGARAAGAEVTLIDLADFPMPLFEQDLEAREGMPEHAARFKELLLTHDGLLIASPEYNSAFSPLLKNALDWASRATSDNEPPLAAYRGKFAALMAASPGALGGLRGLVFLRMLLGNIGINVLATQKAIPAAHEAFAEDGTLRNTRDDKAVRDLGKELAETLAPIQG